MVDGRKENDSKKNAFERVMKGFRPIAPPDFRDSLSQVCDMNIILCFSNLLFILWFVVGRYCSNIASIETMHTTSFASLMTAAQTEMRVYEYILSFQSNDFECESRLNDRKKQFMVYIFLIFDADVKYVRIMG